MFGINFTHGAGRGGDGLAMGGDARTRAARTSSTIGPTTKTCHWSVTTTCGTRRRFRRERRAPVGLIKIRCPASCWSSHTRAAFGASGMGITGATLGNRWEIVGASLGNHWEIIGKSLVVLWSALRSYVGIWLASGRLRVGLCSASCLQCASNVNPACLWSSFGGHM